MRSLNKICIGVFLFTLSLTCNLAFANSDNLIGSWKIIDYQFHPDPVDLLVQAGATEEQIAVAKADIASSMQVILDTSKISYNADGTYVGSSLDDQTNQLVEDSGKWSLSEDGKSLIDTPDGEDKQVYDVLFLSPKTFVFKVTDDDLDISFVLEKQQ